MKPRHLSQFSETTRATTSVGPSAAKLTMSLTGWPDRFIATLLLAAINPMGVTSPTSTSK